MPNAPVLLIDLSSIGHPIWHVSQQEPDPDYTSQRIAAIVRELAAEHPHTAICCDSPISFRKDIDSTYKANRPPAEAALHHQIDLAREALAADGFPVWKVDEFEGDDVIATATHQLINDGEHDVLIASADKDLLALVSFRVEVHSTRTGNRIGPAEVIEKMGVAPGQVVDYLTLVGDSSDNIKGAKGIGPKTAVELLERFGTLDNIYLALGNDNSELKPAQRTSLEELRPRLDNVRSLVTMRTDVPLDINEVFKPRVPKVTEDFMKGEKMEPNLTQKLMDDEIKAAQKDKLSSGSTDDIPPAEPPPPAKTEALVPVEPLPAPDGWERGLEPRSMDDACKLAQRLHDSRMFSAYGTPQAVLSTLMLGRELGLSAMASLRSVHIIEGKHSLSAELMVALVLKSGMAEYFRLVETTDKVCTYETKRKGNDKPLSLSYTIEQAEQAGLMFQRAGRQPGPWHKMPKQMLRARCKSELARLEYPDILAGLYTPEELRDAKNGD